MPPFKTRPCYGSMHKKIDIGECAACTLLNACTNRTASSSRIEAITERLKRGAAG